EGVACTSDSLCPESAPCCSEAGFCGTGRNCLAGCDPLASFKPAACAPIPACVDSEFNFTSTDRILSDGTTWNGDGVNYDWIVDSRALGFFPCSSALLTLLSLTGGSNETDVIDDDQLLLTVSEHGNGTALSSTHSILYGNISAKIKSSPELGLVTSFILLSGTKDEIDWEFTNNLTSAGSAYFYQGDVGDYSAAQELSIANRSEDFHEYGINWTPDCITWTLDGVALRNVTKESTLDASTGTYHYPQTPSRIQLLIWPAGVEGAAQGTIDWAGGLVNFSSPAYNETGYFASYVESVSVTCYDSS
ncbi:concanavalin A-like lectin/glucanase domain-containing protein, partial [Leucosporidium creatinivorum]